MFIVGSNKNSSSEPVIHFWQELSSSFFNRVTFYYPQLGHLISNCRPIILPTFKHSIIATYWSNLTLILIHCKPYTNLICWNHNHRVRVCRMYWCGRRSHLNMFWLNCWAMNFRMRQYERQKIIVSEGLIFVVSLMIHAYIIN